MSAAMQTELRTRLAAALAGLVDDRVAWGDRPTGDTPALPAVTLTLVAPGRDYTHDGADGLDYPWVQCDVWALGQPAAWAVADAIVAEMESAHSGSGIRFEPGFLQARRDAPPDHLAGDVRIFSTMVEFRFFWSVIS